MANESNARMPSFPEGDTLKWENIDRQKPSSAPLGRLAVFHEFRPIVYSICPALGQAAKSVGFASLSSLPPPALALSKNSTSPVGSLVIDPLLELVPPKNPTVNFRPLTSSLLAALLLRLTVTGQDKCFVPLPVRRYHQYVMPLLHPSQPRNTPRTIVGPSGVQDDMSLTPNLPSIRMFPALLSLKCNVVAFNVPATVRLGSLMSTKDYLKPIDRHAPEL